MEFLFSISINDKINDKINGLDKLVIIETRKNIYIAIREIARKLKTSEPTFYRHLNSLMKRNLLSQTESRKARY